MPPLPGTRDCCWVATAPKTNFPKLQGQHTCDAAIVGGGIVGLTAALSLCEQGLSPIVIEARRIGGQVTGRSTAKVTTQHALIYRYLTDTLGPETARLYADANRKAVQQIATWIETFGIACDYQRKDAYTYITTPVRRPELQREAEAARALGFDADVLEAAPLPFRTAGALRFPDQAQFNAASYLVGLALAVEAAGGRIYEASPARSIGDGSPWRIETDEAAIDAQRILVATNIPVKSPRGYSTRTRPRSHVAMAFRLADETAIDGVFIGVDHPTHSIRTGRDSEGPLLVTLGPKFDTGRDGDVAQRFRDLEAWTRASLPAGEALWRWCNEDYDTADRLPFVGQPSPGGSPGFYAATGFNAWGISNGTAAGLMIASDIAHGSHPWGSLYDPVRPSPGNFNPGGETQSRVDDLDQIPAGEGRIVERGKEKLAVWRDPDGIPHALSGSCTHQGCPLTWNNADLTWDCPCHGSIFATDGTVLHGPARVPLPSRKL